MVAVLTLDRHPRCASPRKRRWLYSDQHQGTQAKYLKLALCLRPSPTAAGDRIRKHEGSVDRAQRKLRTRGDKHRDGLGKRDVSNVDVGRRYLGVLLL